MAKIFISYESSDEVTAFGICEYMESRGLECWIAPRDTHAGEYAGEIIRAIQSAEKFVVVCSEHTSTSSHVRNEVSLAFDSQCIIIPFMLNNVRMDDSLEYYFAGKQRVFVNGDIDLGFQNLYKNLEGKPSQVKPAVEPKRRSHPALWISIIALMMILAALAFHFVPKLLHNEELPIESVTIPEETTLPAENLPTDISTPQKVHIENSNLDAFTGSIRNGYPTGTGTYTFRKARRIDMHDSKERKAQAGDYIIGEWENGHLIQGKWHSADGTLIEVLLIGKAPNPDKDQNNFEKCTKR